MIKINVLITNNYWKKYILNPELYLKKQIRKLNKNNNFFKNKRIEFSLMLTENKKIRQPMEMCSSWPWGIKKL